MHKPDGMPNSPKRQIKLGNLCDQWSAGPIKENQTHVLVSYMRNARVDPRWWMLCMHTCIHAEVMFMFPIDGRANSEGAN